LITCSINLEYLFFDLFYLYFIICDYLFIYFLSFHSFNVFNHEKKITNSIYFTVISSIKLRLNKIEKSHYVKINSKTNVTNNFLKTKITENKINF